MQICRVTRSNTMSWFITSQVFASCNYLGWRCPALGISPMGPSPPGDWIPINIGSSLPVPCLKPFTQPTSSPSSSPTQAGIAERPCNSIPVTAATVGTVALSSPLHEASRPLSSAHPNYVPSHPLLHYDQVPFSCPLPHLCITHFIVLSMPFHMLHCNTYFISFLCYFHSNVMFHL